MSSSVQAAVVVCVEIACSGRNGFCVGQGLKFTNQAGVDCLPNILFSPYPCGWSGDATAAGDVFRTLALDRTTQLMRGCFSFPRRWVYLRRWYGGDHPEADRRNDGGRVSSKQLWSPDQHSNFFWII
jgi:hypothetical protein